jgi:Kef-type K+ transport system membrane component KefB
LEHAPADTLETGLEIVRSRALSGNEGFAVRRIVVRTLAVASVVAGAASFWATPAWAAMESPGGQADPIAPLILSVALILIAAKLGGHIAARFSQPPVLGELTAGLLIGNLTLLGVPHLDYLKTDASVDMLARLGVILLLFQVGLESTIAQMMKVGLSSFLVATLGVIGPFVLGYGVGAWLLPDASIYAHIFLGATLTATSVGITARVLKDLGRSQSDEARIILGAAVIDDVQGLVILAVVSGIIASANHGEALSYTAIGLVLLKATMFLVGSLALGVYLSPRLFSFASKLQASGVLLAVGLAFCFLLSWIASAIGLAPIVGAFAAGLVLEDLHYRDFTDRGEHTLHTLVEPVASFLVPIFFVVMGIRTDLRAFAQPGVLSLAVAFTIAAVIGKQACAFGIVGRGFDRLSVGIGMIPRGEVGLIFANMGLTLVAAGQPIVTQEVFSALVVMVIATTLVTPPTLKWSFERFARRSMAVAEPQLVEYREAADAILADHTMV